MTIVTTNNFIQDQEGNMVPVKDKGHLVLIFLLVQFYRNFLNLISKTYITCKKRSHIFTLLPPSFRY